MTMRAMTLVTVAIVGAHPAAAQVVQSVRGAADHFGPGFTELLERRVEFRLLRPGHAVLLWVKPAGDVDLYYPVRSRDKSLRGAGRHVIGVQDIPSPVQSPVITGAPVSGRAGQFAPAGSLLTGNPDRGSDDHVSGYWVLLVEDEPITARDVQLRLGPMSREGGAAAVLERIAPLLVREGVPWAMYTAAVVLQ